MKNIMIETPKIVEEQEIEALFKITINAAFAEQGVGHLTEDIANEISIKMNTLRLFLEGTQDHYYLIAKADKKVVGTIAFGQCSDFLKEYCNGELDNIGELCSLYVLPEYQGQGIGSKLIASLMDYLNENEIEYFCLDSGFKKAQIKWTRKFGKPYKIIKDLWGPGSDHFFWHCKVSALI